MAVMQPRISAYAKESHAPADSRRPGSKLSARRQEAERKETEARTPLGLSIMFKPNGRS